MVSRSINEKPKGNKQKKHKIIFVGDSHARGCASKKKKKVQSNRIREPGAGVVLLTDTAKSEISKFTKLDKPIFRGWANYIAHNASSKGLNQKFKY
jgi:hypothetical protein